MLFYHQTFMFLNKILKIEVSFFTTIVTRYWKLKSLSLKLLSPDIENWSLCLLKTVVARYWKLKFLSLKLLWEEQPTDGKVNNNDNNYHNNSQFTIAQAR